MALPPYQPYESQMSPAPKTQVVITSQPTSPPANFKRDWHSNLTDCTADCGICFCVSCCTPFYQCYKMPDFDEHCCSAWPCCFGPVGSVLMLRYRLMHSENIQGSLMSECCKMSCCFPCMACQLYREQDRIKLMRQQMGMTQPTVITQSGGVSTPQSHVQQQDMAFNQY